MHLSNFHSLLKDMIVCSTQGMSCSMEPPGGGGGTCGGGGGGNAASCGGDKNCFSGYLTKKGIACTLSF